MLYNPGELASTESMAMSTAQEPFDQEQPEQSEMPEIAGRVSRRPDRRGIAVAATYEVLGEGDGVDVVKNVELPWKETVNPPLDASPLAPRQRHHRRMGGEAGVCIS